MQESNLPVSMKEFSCDKIFHIFRMINRIRKSKKSVLLHLVQNGFLPVYIEGYSFSVFSRLKIPAEWKPFVTSKKIERYFHGEDHSEQEFLCEELILEGERFLYLTSDYTPESNPLPLSLLKADFFKSGNLLAVKKCEYFFKHCQNSLIVHFIRTVYTALSFSDALQAEAAIYNRIMTLFSSRSLVIRVDFGKLLILSDYAFYPDPAAIRFHVFEILRDLLPHEVKIDVRTVLSDPSLISEKDLVDEFFT